MASLNTKLQEKESIVNDPYAINEVSYQMGTLNYEGNMTPHSWYQHIKRKTKKNKEKTDSIAINLLAEIVYWYRPYCVREGSREIWKKKYIADILQKSYAELEEKFGYTKDQMRDSFELLQNLGLVLLEFRTVHKNGVTNSNVMFIRVFPEKIKEITESELKKFVPSSENSDDPLIGKFRLASGKIPTTYTETTLKTSKCLNRDKGFAPVEAETPPVEVEERAAIAANGSDKVFYRGSDGMHSVKRETFDAVILEKRPDCSEAEISVAWEVLRQYKNKVENIWGFAIRVIDNQRVDKMKKPPASVKPEAKKPIETEVNVCQSNQEVKMDPEERKFLLENMGNPRYREQTPEQMIEDFRERKRKMQADTQHNTCKKN